MSEQTNLPAITDKIAALAIRDELLKQAGLSNLRVGQMILLARDAEWRRVRAITATRSKRHDKEVDILQIEVEHFIPLDKTYSDGTPYPNRGEWMSTNHIYEPREFKADYFYGEAFTPEELDAEADAVMKTGDLSKWQTPDNINTDTALVHMNSKAYLEMRTQEIEKTAERAGMLKAELEARMASFKYQINSAIEVFRKQLKTLYRVIETIELYMGINEEIIQLREGPTAALDAPIYLRQQLLYMDEEVGDPAEQGIDWRKIDTFDRWLIEGGGLQRVLPQERGVVALRVRRRDKDYGSAIINDAENEQNMNTYFLIRNGENVYRIWAAMRVIDRLFPRRNELWAMFEEHKKTPWRNDKEAVEDKIWFYKRNMLVLQGLLERSMVLQPFPAGVSVLHPERHGDTVKFIYDDEVALPTGRVPFWQWLKELNSGIQRGSRILYVSGTRDDNKSRTHNIVGYQYTNEHRLPPPPKTGLYTVEEYDDIHTEEVVEDKYNELQAEGRLIRLLRTEARKRREGDWRADDWHLQPEVPYTAYVCEYRRTRLSILYNPGDTVYDTSWSTYDYEEPHARKRRLRFIIEPGYDRYIFNYDTLDLADIEFYLDSRIDRKDYVDMMPILRNIKKERLAELRWEGEFANLLCHRLAGRTDDEPTQALIWEAIEWWKRKVIWKRPITKDDAKALRMIEGRVRSQLKAKKK